MAEESSQEKSLDASAKKLEEARRKGDLPMSKEGSALGIYMGLLLAIWIAGPPITSGITQALLPAIESPDRFLDLEPSGWLEFIGKIIADTGAALVPLAILLVAGALIPHALQNQIVVASERIRPQLSHLSPIKGVKKILGARALFEFGKSLVKLIAVAVASYIIAAPLITTAPLLTALDPAAFPHLLRESLISLISAIALVAAAIAIIDLPYQRWSYLRRQRMTFQEMKEEMKSTEGDPHIKAQLRKLRRERARRRMMQDVPTATVVVTNPTHYSVALRYDRSKDAMPVVVAKGINDQALKIREIAARHGVPVIPDPPLARALYANTEIGDGVPRKLWEAVAKIVGLVWAQKGISGQNRDEDERPNRGL